MHFHLEIIHFELGYPFLKTFVFLVEPVVLVFNVPSWHIEPNFLRISLVTCIYELIRIAHRSINLKPKKNLLLGFRNRFPNFFEELPCNVLIQFFDSFVIDHFKLRTLEYYFVLKRDLPCARVPVEGYFLKFW